MATAQITLTETESDALQAISQRTGRTQDQLLREAVVSLITQFKPQADRHALLRQARGIWQDRTDLPVLRDLRGELDRFSSQGR